MEGLRARRSVNLGLADAAYRSFRATRVQWLAAPTIAKLHLTTIVAANGSPTHARFPDGCIRIIDGSFWAFPLGAAASPGTTRARSRRFAKSEYGRRIPRERNRSAP